MYINIMSTLGALLWGGERGKVGTGGEALVFAVVVVIVRSWSRSSGSKERITN